MSSNKINNEDNGIDISTMDVIGFGISSLEEGIPIAVINHDDYPGLFFKDGSINSEVADRILIDHLMHKNGEK